LKSKVLALDARMEVSVKNLPANRRGAFKMRAAPFLPVALGHREAPCIDYSLILLLA
jgi:hypothetical protein